MKKLIKNWINSICYPDPRGSDSLETWKCFADNAHYNRVKNLFEERLYYKSTIHGRDILFILLQRLAKGNWPEVSDRFMEVHHNSIIHVSSLDTAKDEVSSCLLVKPMYMIDKNNQILGIFLSRDVIITDIGNMPMTYKVATRLREGSLLPSKSQLSLIGENLPIINKLLDDIGYLGVFSNYWVESGIEAYVWGAPNYCRPPLKRGLEAKFLFVL